tara:strand:+ start:1681 stop:2445 length:765 start_codon:yes stop_codon:yes gene_type:complete
MASKLSVVIITFNEERNIGRCIDSVLPIADEILVVDSFSTDRTKEIATAKGASFIEHKFDGHIEQKNWARLQAKFEYILSLDADEALTPELLESINEVKKASHFQAYQMNRLTNYCGTWIHHSSWYPDVKTRLFTKDSGEWGGRNPHDKYIVLQGIEVGKLKGDLLHYSYYTRQDHLDQIEKFSSISARAMFEKGTKGADSKKWYKAVARFIKIYLIHLGFLDGKAGFDIARFSAHAVYLKYAKLKKLNHGHST